ncbi:MAG: HD domain-containing protein [Coriobacteriia bacterium]|nr:HD domain-containing protein [Coriobacteriia bacterium]
MSDERPQARDVHAPYSVTAESGEEREREISRITADIRDTATGVRSFSAAQITRARDLLARLYALRRARRLYPGEHPAIAQTEQDLFDVIAAYHAEGVDVSLTFFEDEVLLGEQVLTEDSMLFDQLIRDMVSIGAGSVSFLMGLSPDEIARFSPVIGARIEEVQELDGGIASLAERAECPHILISAVSVVRDDVTVEEGDARELAKATYTGTLELLRELERLIRSNQSLNVSHLKNTARSLVDSILRNRFAMLELSGLKSFDEYTFYHSINVAILSVALGSMLTRDYRFLSTLGVGAILHDIGKMTVDLSVLNKTGPLTSDEWAEMRHHPVRGAEIVALTSGVDRASIVCVLEHHMRYDLGGYPPREPKRRQHIASRIVAVADAYDAMTSQRPYSAPRMQDEAMGIIVKSAGSSLDPGLVRQFVDMLGYFPPRSLVLLNTGETAVVVSPSASDPTRPVIRIIAGVDGTMVRPVDLDLSASAEAQGRSVVRCLDPTGMNVDIAEFL